MAYTSGNPNGLTTSANSTPVVVASDNVVDTAGNQVIVTGTVTAADAASSTVAGQAGQSLVTGTPTANSAYSYAIASVNGAPESFSSIVIFISGTFSATYQFERSPDNGTTWTSFTPFVAGTPQTTSVGTLQGMYHGNVSGVTNVRVRCTAYTSGTINIRFSLGIGTGTVTVGNPVKLFDGNNNTLATIKPASTAPAATDNAIVTVESPNSPLLTSTLNVKASNDATTTGSLAASNATVTTSLLNGAASVAIQISGTFVATITPSVSLDNTNFINLGAVGLTNANTGQVGATIGSAGIYQLNAAGFNYVRLTATSYTSGTAVVTIKATSASGNTALSSPLPPGSSTIGAVNVNTATFGLNPTSNSTSLTAFSNQSITATTVLIAAGNKRLFEYDFFNPNTSGVWVQLFNAATAGAVTLGTTAPLRTIYIPPTAGRDWASPWSNGYGSGIVIACTTTSTGSTAPSSAIQAYVGYV